MNDNKDILKLIDNKFMCVNSKGTFDPECIDRIFKNVIEFIEKDVKELYNRIVNILNYGTMQLACKENDIYSAKIILIENLLSESNIIIKYPLLAKVLK